MSPIAAIPLFLVSVAVMLAAAELFARRLDRLGVRFGLPEALIGLLTAVAADGPEVSSALFALARGAHNVSVGVLVGSNAFNLAAMIGVSALLAGAVVAPAGVLALEGLFAGAVMIIGSAVLLRWVAPWVGAILAGCAAITYLTILLRQPHLRASPDAAAPEPRAPDAPAPEPQRAGPHLADPPAPDRAHHFPALPPDPDPTHHLLALIVMDLALIIAGSAGSVQAALSLGHDWHVSQSVLGVLVLAPLTSMPNALTGVRLGLSDRGAALVGESFNSNTINIGAGVVVPALFVSFPVLSSSGKLQLAWMLGMTFVCLALLARGGGLRRGGALALIVLYLAFATTAVI